MNYITKLAYSCEESEILLKRSSKTIKTKQKKKKKQSVSWYVGTLGATLLEKKIVGKGVIRNGEETVSTAASFQCYLILELILK